MAAANSNVTINMPAALLDKIRILAKVDGRSVSSYLTWVLSNLINRGRVIDCLAVHPLPDLVDEALQAVRNAKRPRGS